MSKLGLRGFASGLFISTSIFAYFYYFSGDTNSITHEEVNQPSSEEQDYLTEQLQNYLNENQLVTIKEQEYTQLVAAKEELEHQSSQKDNKSTIIYQTYLVISPGMSSSQVADYLEKTYIIEDSSEFQKYLEDNNLTQSIKIGEYTVMSTMSFSELVDIIT